MVSRLIRNQLPGNRLRVRLPCPPLNFCIIAAITAAALCPRAVVAVQDDSQPPARYFVRSITEVELTGEDAISDDVWRSPDVWNLRGQAHAELVQSGRALLGFDSSVEWDQRAAPLLAIETSQEGVISGAVFVAQQYDGPLKKYRFSIPADEFTGTRDQFQRARMWHYRELWEAGIAGSAWFRHQTIKTARELGESEPNDERANRFQRQRRDLDDSFALISGGRALSENLQLERVLQVGGAEDGERIPIDGIEGITIREFDWGPLVEGLDPPVDPLAHLIPADQHAVFFPSFDALVTLIETGFEVAGPLGPLTADSVESADTRRRYQEQLGLPLGTVQKIFGPKLIKSIAMTGGDPYFRTGTDVAVLFEAVDGEALHAALQATIAASIGKGTAEPQSGTIGGLEYTGFRSPDRSICSLVARRDRVVIVANSVKQLEKFASVSDKKTPSLSSLDEYRFFRDRYRRDDGAETALVIISDATIRRWCGPRWRIATARRTRVAALLADLHATYMEQMLAEPEMNLVVETGPSVFSMNRYTIDGPTAISETWGTLAFATPISELEIDTVSGLEARGYVQWRQGYQRNWTGGFDPVALRLSVDKDRLGADLTVMPLIDNSQYNTMVDASLGATLDAARNSPHPEALVWGAIALNTESEQIKQFANMSVAFTQVNFLDWLGDAAVVYLDDDPLWDEMADEPNDVEARSTFLQSNLHRIPVGIEFNVSSSIRLTAFLVALRGFVEQSAPGMTVWETRHHLEKPYVRVGPSAESRRSIPDEISDDPGLFYHASGERLVFSLSEAVIHRAIERAGAAASGEVDPDGENAHADAVDFPGDNVVVKIHREAAVGLLAMANDGFQNQLQRQSWSALPILNEWKRMYPDRDPSEVDRAVWKRELVCPGGGVYQWNDEWKTMESTVYGHPGQPRTGPPVASLLGEWQSGNFGLTFEHNGLRARAELQNDP